MSGHDTGRRDGGQRRGTRRLAAVLATAAVAVAPLLSGCGIRTTSVPVDAGPAPSRVSCAAPKASSTPTENVVIRKVYLVCSMQIAPVSRSVPLRDRSTDRYTQVRELLAQLQMSPRIAETKAGFSTAVPGTLEITPGVKGDPRDALRLSEPHDELPSFTLAQIVCTLTADALVAPKHRVILGDPAPGKLRSYTCTPDLRTRSEAADTAGTEVS